MTLRPLAWCVPCGQQVRAVQSWKRPERPWGRYRAQYVYRCPNHSCRLSVVEPYALPAAAAIDWTMPGQRIGDRAKPLSPKTIARIEAGLRKYARSYVLDNNWSNNGSPTDRAMPTVTTATTKALVVPVEGREDVHARPADSPMRTQTARLQDALVVPSGGTWREAATSAGEPFSTVTTRETDALVVPYYGTAGAASSADEPIGTLTTKDRYGVAFIAELRGGGRSSSDARSVDEPLATVVASGNHHMLVRNNTARPGDQSYLSTLASEPARTITTAGHQSLVSIEHLVEDCTFRMLEPAEIQLAMAFGAGYQVLGNRRERVRQLGNGVTPPAAEFLLRAVAESLEPA